MEDTMARQEGSRLLTSEEVSRRTGYALQTLANWRHKDMKDPGRADGPPWVKVTGRLGQPGGTVGYPEQALDRWLAARVSAGVPEAHREAVAAVGQPA